MPRAALIALLLAARSALAQPVAVPADGSAAAGSSPAQPAGADGRAIQPQPGPVPLISPPPPPAPAHPRRWFVLPVVSYLPETGLGAGASFGLHRYVEDAPRPTSIFATALYTTEGQGLLDLAVDSTLPGGAVLAARTRALHYPDRFYGIGPDTQSSQMEHFTRESVELVASAEIPVLGTPFRAGPRFDLRAEDIGEKDAGGQLATGAVPGADGSSFVDAGLSASWDTRDRPFWPSRGTLAQAWFVIAPPAISRTGGFSRGAVELRQFLPLGGDRTLGLHAYGERASGEVPFTLLPRLGNTRFLRGIREGRYRDHVVWALQSELRSPLWWRFSGTAFAAVGDVAPRIEELRLDDPKVAGGAGVRYRLTDEGVNVRVDVAGSRFGVQLYVLVMEAF